MVTAFSEGEKELIRNKLSEAARGCLGRYGVRKTTGDELVQQAGIAKGSFYNFYNSKECLFFNVLEEYQKSTIQDLIFVMKQAQNIGVDQFTHPLFNLYRDVRQSFI